MVARCALLLISTMLAGPVAAQGDLSAAASRLQLGLQAAERGDADTYYNEVVAASRLVPPHPVLYYHLARAAARSGRPDVALATLRSLTTLGTPRDPSTDSAFVSLWPLPEFRQQAAAMMRAIEPRVASDTAFVLDSVNLVVENVAWDSSAGVFYAGSMARSTILRSDSSGRTTTLVPASELEGGQPLGMRVNAGARTLWANVIWLADSARGRPLQRSALLNIELPTGRIRARHTPGDGTAPYLLNDLIIAPDGAVYATDSESRKIWRLPVGGQTLEAWVQFDSTVLYPNGIAVTADGRTIFVAHQTGILAIDRETRRVRPLEAPEGATLMGIDGLYATATGLVGIQNSTPVHQVIAIALEDGTAPVPRVVCTTVLERRHPAYVIPTTGTLAGDALLYVANSELRRLNPRGNLIDPEKEHRTVILRLPVPSSSPCGGGS